MKYIITEMKAEHVDDIVQIENICFSSPWTREGIEEELSNPNAHFLAAVTEDGVCGYIGVQEVFSEAYITNIAVLPQYRKNGIGKALMLSAADGAMNRNCEFLTLEVRESNSAAIRLYESLGFELMGKRKDFYTNPNEDGLIYTLYFK